MADSATREDAAFTQSKSLVFVISLTVSSAIIAAVCLYEIIHVLIRYYLNEQHHNYSEK